MFVYRDNGPAIAVIPKNASTSIRSMLPNVCALTPDEAKAHQIRVAFVRDPFDKLATAYSFLMDLQERGENMLPKAVPVFTSYEQFVDWALESDEAHVRPQASYLKDRDGDVVVTHVHMLADLNAVWRSYYPDQVQIVKRNSRPRLGTDTSYRRADIEQRYAEDIALCQRLSP